MAEPVSGSRIERRCRCHAFFFDPGEDGTPECPVHSRHAICPAEDLKCQYGDDLNCPALETKE